MSELNVLWRRPSLARLARARAPHSHITDETRRHGARIPSFTYKAFRGATREAHRRQPGKIHQGPESNPGPKSNPGPESNPGSSNPGSGGNPGPKNSGSSTLDAAVHKRRRLPRPGEKFRLGEQPGPESNPTQSHKATRARRNTSALA